VTKKCRCLCARFRAPADAKISIIKQTRKAYVIRKVVVTNKSKLYISIECTGQIYAVSIIEIKVIKKYKGCLSRQPL
jgi:hypothetical protein